MTLRAKYVAEGYMSGLHQSPFKGASLEFSQHRQYVRGDELKYLDWKIFGRTNRFYVKQFQEETNLRGYCILDVSSSMGYASGPVTKLEYSTYLSAAIAYMMIGQQDSAGLVTFAERVREFLPARNYKAHLQNILSKLDELEPEGKTDFMRSLNEIGKKINKRSLLVLFSDLFDEPDYIIKTLKFFPYLKNDLIVFHVLDPEEIYLNKSGLYEFRDMETGEILRTRPDVIRKEYTKRINKYFADLETGLRSHNIDYYRITTDMTLDKAVLKFMEGRRRRLV